MKSENPFEISSKHLDSFLNHKILNYSKLRNFDFGVDKRDNISNLSKFISHRVLFEFDVIKKVLNKYPYIKVEKFVQEIFWRVYWKCHLEHKPDIWTDFINYNFQSNENANYLKAINSQTGIECFDEWVKELKEFNYLHNHTRMWFASIWIFTLNLPWQLGAKFFLSHLFDGDEAVNTLSWRWVAGLQTKGKNYIAKSWNVEKFSNKRFSNIKLNENPETKVEEKKFNLRDINYTSINKKQNKFLLMFENDCYYLNKASLYIKYDYIYILKIQNHHRKIQLSQNVIKYKNQLLLYLTKNLINSVLISRDEFIKKTHTLKNFDIVYPFIGENLDFMNNIIQQQKLNINFLHRSEDMFCLDYAKKGFFNFKNSIPKIINKCCS